MKPTTGAGQAVPPRPDDQADPSANQAPTRREPTDASAAQLELTDASAAQLELTDASAAQLELPDTRTTPSAAERTFVDAARDADMPTGAKLIYLLLVTYARLLARVDIGICYPRRDRLKRQAGRMSWNTFEKWLSWLYAEHWVAARTDGRGRMTFYVYSPAGRMRVWATPEIGVAATPEIGVAQTRPLLPGKGSGKGRTAAGGNQGTSHANSADQRQREQQQRDLARIEGLIAAIAARARQLGHDFDEGDERRRLAAREIDVAALQALADDLAGELADRGGDVRRHRIITPGLDGGGRCAVCGRRPGSETELCPGRPRRTRIQALAEDCAEGRDSRDRRKSGLRG